MTTDPMHPVHSENLNASRGNARYRLVATDRRGGNPTLFGYSRAEPTELETERFRRHYATLINAMPREVSVSYGRIGSEFY